MKPVFLIPIIIGGALLLTVGTVLTIGIVNSVTLKKETKEVEITEAFENINIDLDITDVEFRVSEDGKNKVVFEENSKELHEAKVSDNTLYIKCEDNKNWLERFTFFGHDLNAYVYLNSSIYNKLTIDNDTGNILIPNSFTFASVDGKLSTGNTTFKANVTGELNYSASTGNINIDEVNSEKIILKTSTGRIKVDNATSKEMTLSASTGKITLNNVNVEEKIKTSVSTGRTTMNDVKCNDLEITSSTGDITLTNTLVTNHIEIKATTGDITLNDSDAKTLRIKTSTGKVKGTLLTSHIFYVKTDTGRINVPPSTEGGLCEVETDTGNITFTIKQ